MASYQPSQELKDCLEQLFDSEVKLDKVLWELLPTYFKIKIPELKVVSIGLKTNEKGNEIIVSIFIVNTLSAEKLSTILAVLDLINLSTSNSWLPIRIHLPILRTLNKSINYISIPSLLKT